MGQTEALKNEAPLEPSVIEGQRLLVGDLVLDASERSINSRGLRAVKLSKNEFTILSLLAESAGRVVAKDDLLHAVAGNEVAPGEGIVDTYIKYLHRQLQEAKSAVTIEKVPEVGFILRP